ncbi:MAG: excinuclease ABC subunit A [Methylophilus sp.]|uniref:excinuclease ABC subunit A n=1 Tax=Methylophilus sp. TaxID=29541 RepID=UPI003F9F2B80
MKKPNVAMLLVITSFVFASHAHARDDRKMYPVADALANAEVKSKLDPAITLQFGNQKAGAVEKEFGEWKTNKKTNGFNKSDQVACEWAFLSAVLELQERARKEGGNAVIHIKSNYKDIETVSDTEYMCGSGALMSGVALKGTVVKLK